MELNVLLLEGSNGGHAAHAFCGPAALEPSVPHAHLFVLAMSAVPFGARKRACAEASFANGTHEDDGAHIVQGDGTLADFASVCCFVFVSAPF